MSYPGNWRFPRRDRGYGHWVLTRTRVADPQWKVGVNRILGYRIGWYAVLGKWSYGLCKPEDLTTQRARAERQLS